MPGDAREEAGEIAVVRMTATRGQRISMFAVTGQGWWSSSADGCRWLFPAPGNRRGVERQATA